MTHFFNTVRITNFKSLKDVTLNDCKRINVLIGKPNVGKSNILEALGLFGIGCLHYSKNKKLTQLIRFENIPELFFDGEIKEIISVIVNNGELKCRIKHIRTNSEPSYSGADNQIDVCLSDNNNADNKKTSLLINNHFNVVQTASFARTQKSNIRQYKFISDIASVKQSQNVPYLIPPFGNNLFDVLQSRKELRADLASIFSEYQLKLLLDKGEYRLKLMKTLSDDDIITFPYSSIADTLQRIIFYKAAIGSNQNSILLFEEPEAHCFPPYVKHITQQIIDSETNQFFVATHSPYVLTTCLETENSRNDVAIFMVDFKDGQTVINRLTDDERDEVYEYGLDLFFNSELFTDD